MNKKGFSLIEVLIATVILSASILILSGALKLFFSYKEKLVKYQNIYNTTLSIVDKILAEDLLTKPYGEGTLNGLSYRYKAKLIKKGTDTSGYSYEETQKSGSGLFKILLFKVELTVENNTYDFYKTQYKKISNIPSL